MTVGRDVCCASHTECYRDYSLTEGTRGCLTIVCSRCCSAALPNMTELNRYVVEENDLMDLDTIWNDFSDRMAELNYTIKQQKTL